MKTNATLNLKRNVIAAISGLMFIGLLAAGISNIGNQMNFTRTVQAQEEKESILLQSQRHFICSNATLSGRYAVKGDGFVSNGPPPAPLVPFAIVSLMTMDGAGNLSNKTSVSFNGQIMQNTVLGTYTVNSDCTGKMTVTLPNPPFQLNFNLVVSDLQGAAQGKEFYFISTDPGTAITHIAKRVQ